MKAFRYQFAAILLALVGIAACSDSLDDQVARLENHVSKNRVGGDADVWLMKYNAFGEWEKVVLIFGYMHDYDFCVEIAGMYQGRYPAERYSCRLAN